MEKIMIKKHREQRTNIKADRENKKGYYKEKNGDKMDNQGNVHNHGLKRTGSQSWQGDSHKVSKHKHQTAAQNDGVEALNTSSNLIYKTHNVTNSSVVNSNEPANVQHTTVSEHFY